MRHDICYIENLEISNGRKIQKPFLIDVDMRRKRSHYCFGIVISATLTTILSQTTFNQSVYFTFTGVQISCIPLYTNILLPY